MKHGLESFTSNDKKKMILINIQPENVVMTIEKIKSLNKKYDESYMLDLMLAINDLS